ncbi:jg20589 [Pararge aegeria aegeria]|uniref:Jg20589 protein n=1 Tax=Pararge aegeria aegeria TaxID=348720 RepID=A0A8S4RQ20_9NEOP|nr:jg20589 [Pararge aegeria aegeria]
MFAYFMVLLVVGTSAQRPTVRQGPLSYVQARNAFARARLYLQERLPDRQTNITDPETSKQFNFGILAGVTLALVKAFYATTSEYDPLRVLQKSVPESWEDYNAVSRSVNAILAEANAKIRPITTLIDTLCPTTVTVEACNHEVHERVIHSTYLGHRAKFLLQLGRAAATINRKAKLLDNVAAKNNAVPYLFKLVVSTPFEVFIAELTRAYEFIRPRKLKYRRSHFASQQ